MSYAAAVNPLIAWLLEEGRRCASVPELLAAFAPRVAACTPLERIWLGTKVLHPQAAAYMWIWERDAPQVREMEISYQRFRDLEQHDSPILRLRLGEPEVHYLAPDDHGMPQLRSLWDGGYRELLGTKLRFRDAFVGALTWASRTRFSPGDLNLFRELTPVFSAVLEPRAGDLVTLTLLRTYLGSDAGDRVFHGHVHRGDVVSLRAVVWISDVRGFTRLSESLDSEALLGVLNDGFELVVNCVERHGGQVLKFMGDGVLAVFPSEGGDGQACEAALRAALELEEGLGALPRTPALRMGVGLHLGEVSYGNIGSPGRLDFTVIGPAVNLAARVEAQCSGLDQPVLATAQVAACQPQRWTPVGAARMKGMEHEVALFRPA